MTKSTVVPFHSLAGVAIAALIVGCAAPSAEHTQPPNIIVIMADDLGYGDVSPYDGWIETPHLDRLAAAGMMLTDFHTSGAVCSPTRAWKSRASPRTLSCGSSPTTGRLA